VTEQTTLAQLIFDLWRQAITEIEDARIDMESAQMLIDRTRRILREDGASPAAEHDFLKRLRDSLPMLTNGHPLCKQFIEILTNQLESN
jgi:hypothetical protein